MKRPSLIGFGLWALLCCAVLSSLSAKAWAQATPLTIGTGGKMGVYYIVGQSICKLVNRDFEGEIDCRAPATAGSIANLKALRAGELNLAVTQSDWQYHAYHGSDAGKLPGGPYKNLRALFSIHAEPFTVVARSDSGIRKFQDLKGKRVNVGHPGSGPRGTMEVVIKALGWQMSDFAVTSELRPHELSAALCDDKVDAVVFTIGHPSRAVKEVLARCPARMVPVEGAQIEALTSRHDYYAKSIIGGSLYQGVSDDVPTFGVGATVVASTDTDSETVYKVVRSLFENFNHFRKLHPAFAKLKEEDMITRMLSAPLHAGALRYYKERGWR